MAEVSITAANVVPVAGYSSTTGTAGATITAGQVVYRDAATSTLKLADSNASQAAANAVGIALHGASSGQPLIYQTAGDITIGGTIAVGKIYVVGATTPGALAEHTDLTSGWYTKVMLIGKTSAIGTIVNRGPSTLVQVP